MEKLDNVARWEDLLTKSHAEPVIVYIHSDACGISTNINEMLEGALGEGVITTPVCKVVVQSAREVSDQISIDLDLKHESPQLIIIKEGQVLHVASHYDINIEDMLEYLGEIRR